MALSRGLKDGNRPAKSIASASLGGKGTGLLQARPAAKQPAPDGAAADIPSSEVPRFALVLASPHFGSLLLSALIHAHHG